METRLRHNQIPKPDAKLPGNLLPAPFVNTNKSDAGDAMRRTPSDVFIASPDGVKEPMNQNGATALAAPQNSIAAPQASVQPIAKPKRDFDGLVKRYHRQAYNIAYRLTGNHADAEDLTQEAFVRAFRFFDNYRRDLPFENWLFRIISNLFVDELRRKPKARIHSLDAPVGGENSDNNAFFEVPDLRENPERVVLHEELDETIQRALDSLPPDFRMTVVLADIESMSYEEISEAMHCSLGTVRSRLHRGRKLLRGKLAGFGLK